VILEKQFFLNHALQSGIRNRPLQVIIYKCFKALVCAWIKYPEISLLSNRGAAGNFVREGPVTDVVRFQTLAILHKDHFDVTGQFLIYYSRIWRQISSTSRHQ